MIDWKEMFIKYANRVGEEEGVLFLRPDDWTEEERKEIEKALPGFYFNRDDDPEFRAEKERWAKVKARIMEQERLKTK